MNDTKTKKQIVEKIRDSTNVLVALNANPTVDELSAALGVTLAINKIDKHATAVFSGDIPSAIEFLEPEKTFENSVSSLQDFIIALDKEKADHLRYKVDGDVVKIFITPYRTTIDESDLEFSQGDYNVDFVLALGVKSEGDLDTALKSHGQILTDATVASLNLDESSELGTINWNDKNASSYCEMMTSLVKDLGDKDLLDEQISTALLTGIVAATDRFSNAKTSSRVMTTAADLMGAGANQQLIAVQLQQADEISEPAGETPAEQAPEGEQPEQSEQKEESHGNNKGELSISHEYKGGVDEVAEQVAQERQQEAAQAAEDKLAEQLSAAQSGPLTDAINRAQQAQEHAPGAVDYEETPRRGEVQAPMQEQQGVPEPSFGGTLNASTEEAAALKKLEESTTQNHTILSHDSGHYMDGAPSYNAPISAAASGQPEEPEVQDIFAEPVNHAEQAAPAMNTLPPLPSAQPSITPPPATAQASVPTLEQIDQANRGPSPEDALNDVHAAFGTQLPGASSAPATPPMPGGGMPSPALPPLPPMPDFSTLPPLPGTLPPAPAGSPFGPSQSQDNPLSTLPPDPLGSTLPPAPAPEQPGKADPSQFKIPGQP